MPAKVLTLVKPSSYFDSVTLMQVQKELAALEGVEEAGAVMGTDANKQLLAQSGLMTPEAQKARPDDLIIAVRGADQALLEAALRKAEELLVRRPTGARVEEGYRPRTLTAALGLMPDANLALISVPGRFAASVAHQALDQNLHVFLFSDNVDIGDEVELKGKALSKGLLVMGPDCGTAIVNGVGLGFANAVRRGHIGIVAASGTGLQEVASMVHRLGAGVSHALGTGSHDLSDQVGGITTLQAITALRDDPETHVLVLVSKPPSSQVAARVLRYAIASGKPVVVDFIGADTQFLPRHPRLHYVSTLAEAAHRAVELARQSSPSPSLQWAQQQAANFAPGQRYLRALYSGGTFCYEALLLLRQYLGDIYSNTPLDPSFRLQNPAVSTGHTAVDLGSDEFTVGRLHPMMDMGLRSRRLQQEAQDPEVAIVLMDVVLGYASHPDPAGELAPQIATAIASARGSGRHLAVIAFVCGTDADPQDYHRQRQALEAAGAYVAESNAEAVELAGMLATLLEERAAHPPLQTQRLLASPVKAVNFGVEAFAHSLDQQGARVLQMQWQPPAGGDPRLASLLAKLKG
jgi:FdrA protein